MTTKHTPGPWTANRDCRSYLNRGVITDGPMVYGIYTPDTRISVMQEFRESGFGPQDEEQEANARLIAAAPELLDALKEARSMLETASRYFPKSIHNSDRFSLLNVLTNAVNPAIAKAEGEAE